MIDDPDPANTSPLAADDAGRGVPTARLDTRGLLCPLPVLKARKALAKLAPGATLEVLASDPQSPADFAVLCNVGGHTLQASETSADGATFRFILVRGGSAAAGTQTG